MFRKKINYSEVSTEDDKFSKFKVDVIETFREVESKDCDIFFVDLEGVVLQPNMFYELLIDDYFYNLFLRVIEIDNMIPCKISDCIYLGKNFVRYLTDIAIPDVFYKLKRRGSKIFALSSGFPSMQKKDQIRKLGVPFSGFLFTKRCNKGVFLMNFFNSHQWVIGKKICVVDNHIHKLRDIYEAYAEVFPEHLDKLTLILYKNDFITDINIPGFTDYWRQVVQNIMNGRINEIKSKINSIKMQILNKAKDGQRNRFEKHED